MEARRNGEVFPYQFVRINEKGVLNIIFERQLLAALEPKELNP